METFKIECWDCGIKVEISEENFGVKYKEYQTPEGRIVKCIDCYQKKNYLDGFQPCEVFSRIVGYYRPVKQWNVGKSAEFGERVEYKKYGNESLS